MMVSELGLKTLTFPRRRRRRLPFPLVRPSRERFRFVGSRRVDIYLPSSFGSYWNSAPFLCLLFLGGRKTDWKKEVCERDEKNEIEK